MGRPFAELTSSDPQHLEGDERIYLDDSKHPQLYGTGIEDLFNGGFYFDRGPFATAQHGLVSQGTTPGALLTAAYRQFFTDPISFQRSIVAGLEAGPTNTTPMSLRATAHSYTRPRAEVLARRDVLEVGDPASRTAHAWSTKDPFVVRIVQSSFEGDPPVELTGEVLIRPAGVATFTLDARGCADRIRLRRRFDAGLAGQVAAVSIAGQVAGTFAYGPENSFRRWREVDLDLPASVPAALLPIEVQAYALNAAGEHSEARWELWCRPHMLFADGFESGGTDQWSTSTLSHSGTAS